MTALRHCCHPRSGYARRHEDRRLGAMEFAMAGAIAEDLEQSYPPTSSPDYSH